MCGPTESILGRDIEPIVARFITNLPVNFPVAKGPVRLHGALIEIDETTGRALRIERIAHDYVPASTEAAPAAPQTATV